jgi:hypothetical protein
MSQDTLFEETEDGESIPTDLPLERFLEQGWTDYDNKEKSIITSIRLPRSIRNICNVLASRSNKSMYFTLSIVIKVGTRRVEKNITEHRLKQRGYLIREFTRLMPIEEYKVYLESEIDSHIEIPGGQRGARPESFKIAWWVDGALNRLSQYLGTQPAQTKLIAFYEGLSTSNLLYSNEKKEIDAVINGYWAGMMARYIQQEAIFILIGRYFKIAIDEMTDAFMRKRKIEDLFDLIERMDSNYPDEYARYSEQWLIDLEGLN